MNKIDLRHGDCLAEMDKLIERGVKVDMILTDPPYGTTACKWDSVIPFEPMWERINKLIKPNGAILLFGSQPFTSALVMSNIKNYKYDWVWAKERGTGYARANKQPMRITESISVFYQSQPYYYSIGEKLDKPYKHALPIYGSGSDGGPSNNLTPDGRRIHKTYTHSKKNNLIRIAREDNRKSLHPTQKPVALLEYLIKTYTNEGETVLDFTMGSGSTGVAAKNLNRNFIGIELDDEYFEIAKSRIGETQ